MDFPCLLGRISRVRWFHICSSRLQTRGFSVGDSKIPASEEAGYKLAAAPLEFRSLGSTMISLGGQNHMEVFLTGATGYIGSAVAEALQKAGHQVTGLARTPERAKQLEARGVRSSLGDLLKPETVAAPARAAEGVIHTANTNDAGAAQADAAVVRAILKSLEGT